MDPKEKVAVICKALGWGLSGKKDSYVLTLGVQDDPDARPWDRKKLRPKKRTLARWASIPIEDVPRVMLLSPREFTSYSVGGESLFPRTELLLNRYQKIYLEQVTKTFLRKRLELGL
jgi:hypothetical protein